MAKRRKRKPFLYEMLEERNVRVTSLAFSLALGAFEVARMWQEGNKLAKSAFEVFQIDSPDATLTHAIITMAGRAGDLQFASETFENMKNSTLVVTTYSYNALLGGYARYGDWGKRKQGVQRFTSSAFATRPIHLHIATHLPRRSGASTKQPT